MGVCSENPQKSSFDPSINKIKDMDITITKGTGEASTEIAAFDAALLDAGVNNYNLVILSSIIPPRSNIKIEKYRSSNSEFGDRLFVVVAKKILSTPGEEAWAGIGWTRDKTNKSGLFVEVSEKNEFQLNQIINKSLSTMAESRKNMNFGKIHKEIIGIKCINKPVCSVVLAVYRSEKW